MKNASNVILWILQIVLAWFCIAGGLYQIFKFDQLQAMAASMRELPQGLWIFLGACSVVGGLGLLLPGAAKVKPILTAYAAAAVAVESALISGIYVHFGDHAPLNFSLVMTVIAAVIAYGRFKLRPL